MTMKDRLPLVADLLMEAAYADDRLDGDEKDAVKRLLREILEVQTLPMDLDFRIGEFDAEGLRSKRGGRGVRRRCAPRQAPPARAHRRRSRRRRRDRFRRGRHLRAVGEGLGLPPESFKELVVDVVEEIDLGEDLDHLRYG